MQFDRLRVTAAVADLARRGVYIGTSSWKYPGWCGQLYDERRYSWRGRFAQKRFEKSCLAEYAEVFRTVCVDAAYYKFPECRHLEELTAQAPADFLFGFKVTDEITIKRFPELPRFGPRAGRANPGFLNADLFAESFLKPCEVCRDRIGLLIFEFSKFHPRDFAHSSDFVQQLDQFLGELPAGWPYGVEIRNSEFLGEDYLGVLKRHRVAHVYNSWGDMPPLDQQIAVPGSDTHPELAAARLLLKPGRSYEQAVKLFSPYRETKEVNEPARKAAAGLVQAGVQGGPDRRTFIFVNNRLEGNALNTIAAIVEQFVRLPAAVAARGSASAEKPPAITTVTEDGQTGWAFG